jgi:peptide/nickel transport system substrate-binding protein
VTQEDGIVTRHIAWQAALALLGIALVFGILFQLASSQIPVVAVEVPAAGGTYVEGVLGYSETINPILAPSMIQGNPVDQDLSALVFDGLTTLDATGQISPSLALDWEVSEDGTVYEFQLRQDVSWHDGAPFTAADVAFTMQAIQDPNFQGDPALRELWRTIVVDQLDDYAVRFTLQEPFPSFLYYTTIGVLPAHVLSNVAAADLPSHVFSTQRPVGTGRFMVEKVSADQAILVANPNFWGPKPYLEKLAFWFYGDLDGVLADYGQGSIHGFHLPKPQDLQTVARIPNLQLYSAQSAGYGIVYLNLGRESAPFLQEKEVRQALLYALDRQLLIDQVLTGQGLLADSPVLPTTWAYNPSVRRYQRDPERAVGLLDAAGWMDTNGDRIRDKNGVELAFTLLTIDDPIMVEMAEELARQWRAVGVDVTVRALGGEAVTNAVRNRDFDAALIEIGLTADPDPYPLWHSSQAESGQNFAGFASEDADLVMEEGRLTTDPERRTQLYHTFQQIFAEEVPSLLLYYSIYTYAVDAEVQRVQLSPILHSSDRFRNFRDWYIETEEIEISDEENLDKRED